MKKQNKIESVGRLKLQRYVDESSSYREVLLKLRYSRSTGTLTNLLKQYIEMWEIDMSTFDQSSWYNGKRFEKKDVFKTDTEASRKTVVNFLKKDRDFPYKCSVCGIEDWQREKISLALTFKDGDEKNAVKDNLMWICPNCLSQTSTYSRHKEVSSNE